MSKMPTDEGKFCNRVVVNYCSNITNNYAGYLLGRPVIYNSDNFDDIQDVLNYNDSDSEDKELLRDALIFGKGVEINYLDEEGKQRFKCLDPREVIDVYDDTLNKNLLYGIRFFQADYIEDLNESYIVEVYDEYEVSIYRSNSGFSSFELLDKHPHFFNQVPLTFLYLNKEETSIFDQVMSLQNAYNTLLSSEVDDFEGFCDAYLLITGCVADEDDLTAMKKNRVLMLDPDCDARFITKNTQDTQIENMLSNINNQIHKIALSPDMTDEHFMAQSGIAMKFKMLGMENQASAIETEMKKALQKRIELICSILKILGGEEIYRDVQITFTRNLPENVVEDAQMVNTLRGLVSNETLLSQLPFVENPKEEAQKVNEERQLNMEMYDFGETDDKEEEEE